MHPASVRIGRGAQRLFTVLLVAAGSVVGATLAPRVVHGQDTRSALQSDIEAILSRTPWRNAEWGVVALSLESGETLYAHSAERPMVPASNLKILTTAAALHYLGPDFRYTTLVLADGEIRDGVLEGDLILYGTGDPGLSDRLFESETAVLERLADDVVGSGIRTVDGGLVGDGSYFAGPLLGEGWDPVDFNDWFAAPTSALSFNENVVTFRIEPGPWRGAAPIVHTVPEAARVPVINEASTAWGRLYIDREAPSAPIRVIGEIPPGSRDVWRQMAVGDPTLYAATAFRNVLEQRGVHVRGRIRGIDDPAASRVTGRSLWVPGFGRREPRVVATHRSPPLVDYLEVVNKVSHNLYAELTLKTLGKVVAGDGSFDGGARVVKRFLFEEVGIVDTAFVHVLDGSGLSSGNRVRPVDLARTIAFMAETDGWEAFWRTLPEAGNRRELARMYRTAAAGNLRAKTGTIEGVSALSGLVRSRAGERIAFSIIGNTLPSTWAAKRIEDRIGSRLAAFSRPVSAQDRPPPNRVGSRSAEASGRRGGALGDAANAVAAAGEPNDGSDRVTGVGREGVPMRHTVQRGESFSSIAHRYGLELTALLEANPGTPPRRLRVGQTILIPGGQGGR